jgi:hypothetical protein
VLRPPIEITAFIGTWAFDRRPRPSFLAPAHSSDKPTNQRSGCRTVLLGNLYCARPAFVPRFRESRLQALLKRDISGRLVRTEISVLSISVCYIRPGLSWVLPFQQLLPVLLVPVRNCLIWLLQLSSCAAGEFMNGQHPIDRRMRIMIQRWGLCCSQFLREWPAVQR